MTEPADTESVTATTVDSPDDDPVSTTTDSSDDESSVDSEPTRDDDHLADVEEGAGCTEIWEHLSEQRDADEE